MDVCKEIFSDSFKNPKCYINWQRFQEEVLMLRLAKINQPPVKEIWKKLPSAFNHWLNIPEDKFKVIDHNMQLYRNTDRLYDDFSSMSKNIPDFPIALHAYLYSHATALNQIWKLESNQETVVVYKEHQKEVCRSRFMELNWRETVTCPTEEEYIKMVVKKTSGLITMQVKLMQLSSTNKNDLTKLAALFGLYFQILDDYQCLNSDHDSKDYCKDVTLGRFSFPIIHAVRSGSDCGDVIIRILRQRTTSKELKKYVVHLLNKCKSFDYTKNKLGEIREMVIKEIQKLGKNPLMENIVKEFLNFPSDSVKLEGDDTEFPISSDNNKEIDEKFMKLLKHVKWDQDRALGKFAFERLSKLLQFSGPSVEYMTEIMCYLNEHVNITDDLGDDSDLRRGFPTVHMIYGVPSTVNGFNYIIANMLQYAVALNRSEIIDKFLETLIETARGQGMDVYWRNNCICPTEAEYLQMISKKTCPTMIFMASLLYYYKQTEHDFRKLAAMIGIYHQIFDDYQNLANQMYSDKRGVYQDITEGNFSLPVIHAINNYPDEGKVIMDILKQRTNDMEKLKRCVSLIEKCGSFEYIKKKLDEIRDCMREEAKRVLGDVYTEELVDVLLKIQLAITE